MKKLHYILGLCFAFAWQSCLEPVDLDLPAGKSKLVVVSNFTNSRAFEVIVTETNQSTDDENDSEVFVNNATVTISTGDSELETLMYVPKNPESSYPKYVTRNVVADIGVVYEITVSAPGFEPVTSFGFIPEPTSINSASANKMVSGSLQENKRIWVSLEISDPGGVDNFYHLNIYQRALISEISENGTFESEKIIGPLQMFNVDENMPVTAYINNRGMLIKDEFFDGRKRKFFFEVVLDQIFSEEVPNDILIELRTVSREYYLYYLTLKRQADKNDLPLSDPTLNFTNIENGLGIFAGFSSAIDTIYLPR
ncbi:MAG TPA: DUF4249 domain-containing protein [Saprospiraceae bacterium]|nr:DUF4249 domain-containing protein [Saprospiraceae bacterium]